MILSLIFIFLILSLTVFISAIMEAISILAFLFKWGLIAAGLYLLIKEIYKFF